ncbi:hypothetical protein B0H21DRAFT_657616, partial [Amylocystis lapponica]
DWMTDHNGQLLFWVPPHLQLGLWRPSNTAVMGPPATHLDMTHFVHGTAWHKCY